MKTSTRLLSATLMLSALGFGLAPASAATYPDQPVTLVVPFPPGGTSDTVGRIYANALAKELGVSVVVENKAGAGGSIGARYVASAKPDGYTLLLGTSSTNGTNPAVYKSLPYDAINGFTPITEIIRVPGVLSVNKDFAAKDYPSLKKLIQDSPDKYSYASSGAGGATNLAMEYLKSMDNLKVTHVPYRGTGPALNDVIGGQVPMIWDTLVSSLPHIKAGNLVAVGIAGKDRVKDLPNVPTFAELGLPDYEAEMWNGVLAPAGLPADVLKKLHTASVAALSDPEVIAKYESLASRVIANTPEEFKKVIEVDVEKWTKVAKEANISLN
ncbi:Bug family tripartite tricarboxylate transporter substrate binding protein [Pollutimonas harenae]|uniref:Tripartite tricarboxylate transporter substrate binding protein n=1 Tax=Pollutimonas harenae TaxID=657015 RepID=A0A853H2E0_9BURK|nr:tripartite tricarboxylate transporter substrate binding protein [Pollutimonas harenae]NYT84324.1 tripartite tricarboxylate transporter substrate binding protein [Pollutimonas harenae]TEA73274.1 tripartite tricarboxylate transporter substrate binding protein [Pollutimonas harenae]